LLEGDETLSGRDSLDEGTGRVEYAYKRRSARSFKDAIDAVERSVRVHGFIVHRKYDIGGTVGAKGFNIRPLVILEIGPAEEPSEAPLSLVLPCRINIYEEDGQSVVAALRPTVFGSVYPEHRLDEVVEAVEATVIGIVDGATG